MRMLTKVVLAGAGAMSLAGAAYAANRAIHTRDVALPDGGVARITYVGDQAPAVTLVPIRLVPVAIADPRAADPVFADMQRIMAQMDARMDAMIRAAATMPANASSAPDGTGMIVSTGNLPAGTVSYSYVSTSTGANGCTRTVEMTSNGHDAQPKIVRTSAGDCGTEAPEEGASARIVNAPVPATPTVPATPARRDTI